MALFSSAVDTFLFSFSIRRFLYRSTLAPLRCCQPKKLGASLAKLYSPKCLEKLSKKSLSSVSSAEIAVISQRNEPSSLCFVGFDAFVLRLARLFRQSLEGGFSEVHLQDPAYPGL